MSVLPKGTFGFNVIPIKISMAVFTEMEKKKLLKFICHLRRPPLAYH